MAVEESRSALLKELASEERRLETLNAELNKYRDCDPEVLESMRQEADVAREAANRWTDNIFATKSWVKKKFAFDDGTIDKQFGIPAEFDYLE